MQRSDTFRFQNALGLLALRYSPQIATYHLMNHWNTWSLWLSVIVLPSKKCWRPAMFRDISGVPLCDHRFGAPFCKKYPFGESMLISWYLTNNLAKQNLGTGIILAGFFFQKKLHFVGPINFEAHTQMIVTRQLMSFFFVTCTERILCSNFAWTSFFVPFRRIPQS